MNYKDIQILSYNSFFGSVLITHFLSGCDNYQIRNELIFLLLPLVFNNESREILNKCNSRSTLNSTFLDSVEGRTSLGGLEKRVVYFRKMTQTSLIVSAEKYNIIISNHIKINDPIEFNKEKDPYLKEFYKASHYCGKILSKNDLLDTFIRLGLKEI